MELSVFDIAKGVSWTNEGLFYLEAKNNTDTSWIVIEYLNTSTNSLIEDLKTLNEFNILVSSKDKMKVESYIMENLYGFSEYDEGIFAFIAGSTDKSPSVIYDFDRDSLFLIHPNLQSEGRYEISLKDLLFLINQKCQLIKTLSKLILRKH